MGTRRQFSREFKLEAVEAGKDRGMSVAQAARELVATYPAADLPTADEERALLDLWDRKRPSSPQPRRKRRSRAA